MKRLNSAVRRFIRSSQVKKAALTSGAAEEFASAYVGGHTVGDALRVTETLHNQGLLVSLVYLSSADDEADTPAVLSTLLAEAGDAARGVELSVKPSSLGLREDRASAQSRLLDLCSEADARGAVVTLEMQGTEHYDDTLALWRAVHERFETLGITLPADIRRSERDVTRIAAEQGRVRLCVGSYPVPPAESFRSEREKSLAFVRCIRRAMEDGAYPMVATHDPTIIAITQDLARRNGVGPTNYEHQMFYGVRPLEQRRLTDIGLRSRTYVPFGPGWFEYLTTRISARPRVIFSYLRAIADKR